MGERFLVVSREFSDYAISASRSRERLPCKETWTVYFNMQASQISAIKGTYAIVCL
jgi:hypothetical protein